MSFRQFGGPVRVVVEQGDGPVEVPGAFRPPPQRPHAQDVRAAGGQMFRVSGTVQVERGHLGVAAVAQPVEPAPDRGEERFRVGDRAAGQGFGNQDLAEPRRS